MDIFRFRIVDCGMGIEERLKVSGFRRQEIKAKKLKPETLVVGIEDFIS
jgi:hypothetical protein